VPLTNVIIEIHIILLYTLHNTKNIAYHITVCGSVDILYR